MKQVIIIGGGYTAIETYRKLLKDIRSKRIAVTVISVLPVHVFHGWTGEILSGVLSTASTFAPLRRIFSEASLFIGRATQVFPDKKMVQVEMKEETKYFSYDELVIASGSIDKGSAIPGAVEYSFLLRSPEEINGLKNHVLHSIQKASETADERLKAQLLRVIVVGGGFAGVEMAAAIAELGKYTLKLYPQLVSQALDVVLIHSGSDILPEMQHNYPKLISYAKKCLNNRYVRCLFESKLNCIDENGVWVDGKQIEAKTVLCTVGAIPSTIPMRHTNCTNRYFTKNTLQLKEMDEIWSGGDVANVPYRESDMACPTNALWAIKHGQHIGKNISRKIHGKPLLKFHYPGLGQAASLGIGCGITELYGMQFTGWFGWILRVVFFLNFMPLKRNAMRVGMDFLSVFLTGRILVPSWSSKSDYLSQKTVTH